MNSFTYPEDEARTFASRVSSLARRGFLAQALMLRLASAGITLAETCKLKIADLVVDEPYRDATIRFSTIGRHLDPYFLAHRGGSLANLIVRYIDKKFPVDASTRRAAFCLFQNLNGISARTAQRCLRDAWRESRIPNPHFSFRFAKSLGRRIASKSREHTDKVIGVEQLLALANPDSYIFVKIFPHDEHARADAAQYVAQRLLASMRTGTRFSPELAKFACNAIARRYRAEFIEKQRTLVSGILGDWNTVVYSEPNNGHPSLGATRSTRNEPDDEARFEDANQLIKRAMSSLEPIERELLDLFFGLSGREGDTVADMREKTGLSAATIKNRIHTALDKIRTRVENPREEVPRRRIRGSLRFLR